MAGGKWWFVEVAVMVMVVQWWGYNGNLAEGYPEEDLVVKLPGQPEVTFRQYAGYVDVDVKAGRSLFYYFVEAEKQPHTKPLTLWLNGGPGCSSIRGGAFTELGPFYPNGDGRSLRRNSESWNKASNLLFVDSPAGVGWSYSNTTSDYITGDESTAKDMLVFMLRWLEKFPEFKTRNLFLAGESYAGHYIPQLADVILKYNAQRSNRFKFNLKGIAIGNPLLKLDRDIPATYEFFWSHGMISDELGLTVMNQCDFEDYTFSGSHNISKSCEAAMSEAGTIITRYVNYYDVLLDVCYPSLFEQEMKIKKMGTHMSFGVDVCMSYEEQWYLTLPEVQKALHANRTQLPYTWSMCNSRLKYNDNDGNTNMLPFLKRIVQSNVPVWVFSGDEDSVIPLLGSRTLVRELAEDLNFKTTVPYRAWFHKGQVGGWVIEYGNLLTFATVRGAAHMVPYAQPSRALLLFNSFVLGRRLPKESPPILHG
ncbi:Serine carboxypeptidase-like 44 [Cardamine amara subsp. amara]|uniref:Carboxypeptidase n=1 Tax=Cardamine amara subsp. amara TaxID=228776 RepID=A0ABD0ZW10_CARAN